MANEVRIVVSGDSAGAERALNNVRQKVQKFAGDIGAAGRSIALLAAPIVALGGLGLRTFGNFEQSMARVKAVSGATAEQFSALEAVAKEMGETTVFTASQSAEALTFMSMAGMRAEESITALPAVLQLAAAGGLELATAADIVTNVMAGFGLEADQLSRANDVLVTGFTSANTDLTQLGQAFKFAGPVAKAAGISFEETTAALSLMGNAGIQASLAGTSLRGAISRLLSPTGEAAKIIADMGLRIKDSGGNILPVIDIVRQLEKTGITAGEAMQLFGLRAGPAMLALVEQGSAALAALTSKMESSGGTAERIAQTQLDTFQGSMTLLKSKIEAAALSLGESLAPMIRGIAERVGPLVENITEWINKNETLAKIIFVVGTGLVAVGGTLAVLGLVLPGIITAVSMMGAAFTVALGPVGLIAAGIGAAIVVGILLIKNWTTIKEKADQIFSAIANLFRSKWGWILPGGILIKAMLALKDNWRAVWNRIQDIFGTATRVLENLIESLANNWIRAINLIIRGLNKIPGVSISTLDHVKLSFSSAWDEIKEKTLDLVSTVSDGVQSTTASVKEKVEGLFSAFDKDMDDAMQNIIDKMPEIADAIPAGLEPGIEAANALNEALSASAEHFKTAATRFGPVVTETETGQKHFVPRLPTDIWRELITNLLTIENTSQRRLQYASLVASFGPSPGILDDLVAKLGSGGIVNRPTLAMIGEKGPEAVVPLGRGFGLNINFYGPTYGFDDLTDRIGKAIRQLKGRGGLPEFT